MSTTSMLAPSTSSSTCGQSRKVARTSAWNWRYARPLLACGRRECSTSTYSDAECRFEAEAIAPTCLGGTRRSFCSRSIAELFLVHHPAEGGGHAGALVEAERAGVVRRVDAEPDAVLTALPEASERVAEERRAHALLAPRATREECVDKAAAVGVARADRAGGDLVPGADDAPERRIEAVALEV